MEKNNVCIRPLFVTSPKFSIEGVICTSKGRHHELGLLPLVDGTTLGTPNPCVASSTPQ